MLKCQVIARFTCQYPGAGCVSNYRYTMAKGTRVLRTHRLRCKTAHDIKWTRQLVDFARTFASSLPGLSCWLHISPETLEIFCCVSTDCGPPLLAFSSTEPVSSISRKRSFTKLADHFFRGYSEQICLASRPFYCLRILIKHLFSYVNSIVGINKALYHYSIFLLEMGIVSQIL